MRSALLAMIQFAPAAIPDGPVPALRMLMNNPSALTDEVLDEIESLLRGYDTALDNILYKHRNTWPDQLRIRRVLQSIEFARHGQTDDELMRDFESFGGTTD